MNTTTTRTSMTPNPFTGTLDLLERAFRQLEMKVPPPKRKTWSDGFVFRFVEQTIQQAIVQKLARIISGLHAIETLLARGLFQEQGVIQRAVDELQEDIWFLSLAIIKNDVTPRHKEYLLIFMLKSLKTQIIFSTLTRAAAWSSAKKFAPT